MNTYVLRTVSLCTKDVVVEAGSEEEAIEKLYTVAYLEEQLLEEVVRQVSVKEVYLEDE